MPGFEIGHFHMPHITRAIQYRVELDLLPRRLRLGMLEETQRHRLGMAGEEAESHTAVDDRRPEGEGLAGAAGCLRLGGTRAGTRIGAATQAGRFTHACSERKESTSSVKVSRCSTCSQWPASSMLSKAAWGKRR